jgi:amphi-Trp domain-containing protein
MPEEQVFSTEQELERAGMAAELRWLADAVETGRVAPEGEEPIELPERCRYEFELERLTSSETGEVRHELEVEIRWTT